MFLLFDFLSVLRNLISVKVDSMLANNSLSFITNNVLGIQSSKKRLKFNLKCQRQNSVNWSMISTRNSPDCQLEQKWKRDFKEHVVFFSQRNRFLWCPDCLLLLIKSKKLIRKVAFYFLMPPSMMLNIRQH